MPTILSVLGLSVAEMALLHMQRPLLSLLLSLAAPAAYPSSLEVGRAVPDKTPDLCHSFDYS
jgi:hypothetical protein